jgi:hypothetical protein
MVPPRKYILSTTRCPFYMGKILLSSSIVFQKSLTPTKEIHHPPPIFHFWGTSATQILFYFYNILTNHLEIKALNHPPHFDGTSATQILYYFYKIITNDMDTKGAIKF